ncbi:MAG: PilZ domain-containing protein [Labilithrix sp.]|nr:PilZ domain-containing protein [Labilithrix sp.]
MTPSLSFPSVVQQVADRRRAHRARLAVAVTITVAGRLVDAVGADVSPGGMRLVAARAENVGDEVSLVFFLNGDIVCARGTICWCAPTRRGLFMFGVKFSAVEEDGQALVASYCLASVS